MEFLRQSADDGQFIVSGTPKPQGCQHFVARNPSNAHSPHSTVRFASPSIDNIRLTQIGFTIATNTTTTERQRHNNEMDQMHGGFRLPSISVPPLMNQPPQIFGGYSEHGMPLHQLPPDLTAHMFGDPNSLMDDANEAKRRRIARVSTSRPSKPWSRRSSSLGWGN